MNQSEKACLCKLGLSYHPWSDPVRATLVHPATGVHYTEHMHPVVKEELILIHRFLLLNGHNTFPHIFLWRYNSVVAMMIGHTSNLTPGPGTPRDDGKGTDR